MRYPNIRYGNPTELNFYAAGIPLPMLARRLRRDERTVRDWLTERARIPWWVPEVLRLQQMEARDMMRQHTQHIAGRKLLGRPLAIVTPAGEFEARRQVVKKPQAMTDLRLTDFDPVDLTSRQSVSTLSTG